MKALTRLATHLIPRRYRDEVLADLRDSSGPSGPSLLATLRSARDARRQIRSSGARDSVHHGIGADILAAWRLHRSRPGATVGIVAILAISSGLNTAIFSMVDAVVDRPLPFADAERVQFLWTTSNRLNRDTLTPARALDFRSRVTAFEQAAFIGHLSMTVTGRGAAERWYGASVSANFFELLQSPPLLGRTFTTAEPNREVVVLSHRLWADQFGADPTVVGRAITMNGRPRTVVGVMPGSFYWPSITATSAADNPPLFWTCAPPHDVPEQPVAYAGDITQNRTMGVLRMVTRLRADRTAIQAQQEVDRVASELSAEFPHTDGGEGAALVDARTQLFGAVSTPMRFVLLASSLVVLVACINVGALLLVRLAARRREFAVRAALGAGRARLARMLCAEGVLLATVATSLGVAIATLALPVLVAATPESVGRLDQVTVNARVWLWSSGMGVLTAVVLAGLSILALWKDRPAGDLRGSGTAEPSRAGLRRALVGLEVALALALLVGASLFGHSLWRLQRVDVGLNPDQLLTFDVIFTGERAGDRERRLQFYSAMFEKLGAIPGIDGVSGAVTLPIGGDDFGSAALPEFKPLPPPGSERRIGFQVVWQDWFGTLGMHIVRGRDFGPQDRRDATGVAIINESLAALEWPGQDPIGRRLKYTRDEDAPWLTIVGVVSNVHHLGPGQPARPELYLPYSQMPMSMMAVAIRARGDALSLVPAVREAIAAVDPTQPASGFSTMALHLERTYGRARFLSRLTSLFALLAAGLTLVGVYGVTSYAVAQRTREFGVRTALGARPVTLLKEVLDSSLRPVWLGMLGGLALAVLVSRQVSALLFNQAGQDLSAYALAIATLVATAALAGAIPARRAARIDPVKALRGE